MLNRRTGLFAAAALLVVAFAVVVSRDEPTAPTLPVTQSKPQVQATPSNVSPPAEESGADLAPQSGYVAAEATSDDAGGSDAGFRTSAAGELLLDEKTRLHIEALVAGSDPNDLNAAIRERTQDLPPAAANRVEELVNNFVQYQQAQRQTYPPNDAPITEDDAVRELEGLHALREAHFGPEVARLFYEKEEAIAREMIEVLRVENDPSLTPQEKVERARALREQLPGVAAIERSNREAATQNDPPNN